jgi:DNA invertase Pin-like site-specific DNA recombinase
MSQGAAIYCRISRDPTRDELGVKRQQKACEALCESKGWHVSAVFTDDDRSAYSGKKRPAYLEMLERLASGEFDRLVAWHPDRFTRSTRELEDLIDAINNAKAQVATVQTGAYDLTTPSGRMNARLVGTVARYESEHKSERIKAKALELAERGVVGGGGTRPFGFEDDRITINKAEAKVVRQAARDIVNGRTLRAVVADLNDGGVTTPTGAPWRSNVLKRILTAPRIAGKRQHRGEVIGKAVWKPILDDTTWHRVRAILLDPERKKGGQPRRYLLTGGIAVCGKCGANLVARPRQDKQRCYVCASGPNFDGCGGIRALAEPFERFVLEMVAGALDAGALDVVQGDESEDEEHVEEVRRLEADLDALADDLVAGVIGREAFAKASARIEARLTDVRRVIAAAAPQRSVQLDADVDLGDVDLDRQRAIVSAVVDRVIVKPGLRGRNRFDPDRFEIAWRA